MREEMFYKVLWVEDDLSIIQGYQITAEAKDPMKHSERNY